MWLYYFLLQKREPELRKTAELRIAHGLANLNKNYQTVREIAIKLVSKTLRSLKQEKYIKINSLTPKGLTDQLYGELFWILFKRNTTITSFTRVFECCG